MADSVDRLKMKRTAVKERTSSLINQILKSIEDGPNNSNQVEEKMTQLKEKKDALLKLDEKIQKVIPVEELQEDVNNCEDFQEKIISCKVKAERYLNQENSEKRNETTSRNSGNHNLSIKLPRLTIDKFHGDPSEWQNFWAQFNTSIHTNESLSKVDKFNYLKSFLEGPATNAICGLSLTEPNYDVAVKILSERFGRKDLVISAHMHNLLNVVPVKRSSDVQGLRKLYDNCEIQVRSLESMGVPSNTYSSLLCPLLLKNIPLDIALEFNKKRQQDTSWDVSELLSLLRIEIEGRERTLLLTKQDNLDSNLRKDGNTDHKKQWKPKQSNLPSAAALTTTAELSCIFCSATDHLTQDCSKKSVSEKKEILSAERRCFKCLRKNHLSRFCRSKGSCKYCKQRHHYTICDTLQADVPAQAQTERQHTLVASVNHQGEPRSRHISLQTAQALAKGGRSNLIIRCLFDSGSQRSFVRQDISRKLGLEVLGSEKLTIHTFGEENPITVTRRRVRVPIFNVNDPNVFVNIEALESPVISSALIKLPSNEFVFKLQQEGICLSDVHDDQNEPEELTLLIGSDFYWEAVTGKVKRLGSSVVALETLFGWTLHGPTSVSNMAFANEATNVMKVMVESGPEDEHTSLQLRKFWELESIGITDDTNRDKIEGNEILKEFNESVQFENDHYVVKFPWKPENKDKLASNYLVAVKRFDGLVKRFKRDPLLFSMYSEVIREYLDQGIVEIVKDEDIANDDATTYYLPHRAVVREDRSTTKLRIVFDASSHEEGQLSLNDCLWPGPNLTPELFDLLIRFREKRVAFVADVEKAFLQIHLSQEDKDVTRFLWIENENLNEKVPKIIVLRFTRVVFGVTSSPFLLSATVKRHIQNFKGSCPDAFELLNDSLYVDDLIGGASSDEKALKVSLESKEIMAKAGFCLRKWQTNSELLRREWENQLPLNDLEPRTFAQPEVKLKVLGLAWNPSEDVFYFDATPLLNFLLKRVDTKRFILQAAGRIFDPVGMLSPYTIRVKCIFQELWTSGVEWDAALPTEILVKWNQWCSELLNLCKIKIPRTYTTHAAEDQPQTVELHCFCDSSERAYGAAIYLRVTSTGGTTTTSLICSKSRVAPLKKVTIPRLELMGALLAARLGSRVKNCLTEISCIYYWTDSRIVYYWIRGQPNKFKPFIQNRVSEIQTLTDPSSWLHCPGKDNPADILSRGQDLLELSKNEVWWKGPKWLSCSIDTWPSRTEIVTSEEPVILEELRNNFCDTSQNNCAIQEPIVALLDAKQYSSLKRLIRVTAWILRFVSNAKNKNSKFEGCLSAMELENAEEYWVKFVQNECFSVEIRALKNQTAIPCESKISTLNPFIDDKELLRVGGRIEHGEFSYEQKHPIILPGSTRFTELLINSQHQKTMHSGVSLTLAQLRNKFWIMRGRQYVKKILNTCLTCKRISSRPANEITAPLPKDRICQAQAFQVIGLDFAGPLYTKGKNKAASKSYILLITCAVTRAIHLELVSDLTTDKFLLALRRFFARRGISTTIYSDNAQTFKRAEKELSAVWKIIQHEKVQNYLANEKITWKFLVPKAAWWAGFYERLVRTVKTCLKKQLGKALVSFEELTTILAETEGIINCRPLTFTYNSASEPEPLTPAHFLTGGQSLISPPHQVADALIPSTSEELTKRKKYRQALLQRIWSQWKNQYLLDLRSAHHLTSTGKGPKIKENDVVLVKDEKKPKLLWKTGVVIKLFPGRDGKIRSCLLRTASGSTLKRPVQLLYPMELN